LVSGSIDTSQIVGCTIRKAEAKINRMRIPFAIPDAAGRAFDVVGFGENSVDLVAVTALNPASPSKQQILRFDRTAGGQIATAMVGCRRLGWRARYIGTFGDDDAGQLSRGSLVEESVDVSAALTVTGAANRFAIILVDADSGERTVFWHRDPAMRAAWTEAAAELSLAAASGRLLLVDGEDARASTHAAHAARRVGVPTVVDVENPGPETAALLREIDVVIAAEELPGALTGHTAIGQALEAIERESGARLVCVTLGSEGSLARCAGREIRTRPFGIACADTTGAGDAFRAGFLAACLRAPDGEVEDALDYANAVAALNCRGLGARGGLPGPAEVDALLRAGSR
jgi:sugar/nucleoside kinase (ribokinase family)